MFDSEIERNLELIRQKWEEGSNFSLSKDHVRRALLVKAIERELNSLAEQAEADQKHIQELTKWSSGTEKEKEKKE